MQSPFFRFSGGFRPVRGVSRAVTGCSEGVPGVFRVVLRVLLGCSGSVPGCSEGASGVFRECSGVFWACSCSFDCPHCDVAFCDLVFSRLIDFFVLQHSNIPEIFTMFTVLPV